MQELCNSSESIIFQRINARCYKIMDGEKIHSMKTEQWIAMCSGMDICTKEIFPHLAGKVIKIPFLFPNYMSAYCNRLNTKASIKVLFCDETLRRYIILYIKQCHSSCQLYTLKDLSFFIQKLYLTRNIFLF